MLKKIIDLIRLFLDTRDTYIYGIRIVGTKKYLYIGQSVSPDKRFARHILDAKNNKHINKKLGVAIVKNYCTYDIIEFVPNRIAKQKELEYIKRYKPLYNISNPITGFALDKQNDLVYTKQQVKRNQNKKEK